METNIPNWLLLSLHSGFTKKFNAKWKSDGNTRYFHAKYKDTSYRAVSNGVDEFRLTITTGKEFRADFFIYDMITTFSLDKKYVFDMVIQAKDLRTEKDECFILCLWDKEEEQFKMNHNGVGFNEYYRKV